jgi:hypothetical protein
MASVQGTVYGHSDCWGIPFDFYAGATGVVTGSTFAMQTGTIVFNAGATIAALTVTLPLNPPDGARAEIITLAQITSLTVNANTNDVIVNGILGAIVGPFVPTASTGTGSATAAVKYVYSLNGAANGLNPRTWLRVQ